MLARILGEVGTFCTVLLSVSSKTWLPVFIQIGSYLTDTAQKITWHVLRHIVFFRVFVRAEHTTHAESANTTVPAPTVSRFLVGADQNHALQLAPLHYGGYAILEGQKVAQLQIRKAAKASQYDN